MRGPATRILGPEDARALASAALSELEQPGGLSTTSEASLRSQGDPAHPRQWEFPNGWAPHQMIAWAGLRKYAFVIPADRLTYRWLQMIASNAADHAGTIPEKFNVVTGSHDVFAEYGNVKRTFPHITREGFGWMNASYEVGLQTLSEQWLPDLERLCIPSGYSFD